MRAWIFQDCRQKKKYGENTPWSVGWIDPGKVRRSKRIGSKSMAEKFRRKVEGQLAAGTYEHDSCKSWEDFKAEDREVPPRVVLTIRDSDGEVVDRLNGHMGAKFDLAGALDHHVDSAVGNLLDLIAGAKNSYIVTLVERHTRYAMLARIENKDTTSVVAALARQVQHLPRELRRLLTWDRGKELADHKRLALAMDLDIYFCDPHSPWQRGTNENTNGLLRQYLPRGKSMSGLTQDDLDDIAGQLRTDIGALSGFTATGTGAEVRVEADTPVARDTTGKPVADADAAAGGRAHEGTTQHRAAAGARRRRARHAVPDRPAGLSRPALRPGPGRRRGLRRGQQLEDVHGHRPAQPDRGGTGWSR